MVICETPKREVLSESFRINYNQKDEKSNVEMNPCQARSTLAFLAQEQGPVGQWLEEIRHKAEMESLIALQAKSVAIDPESFEALTLRNAQISIRKIRFTSVQIIDDIDYLVDRLPLTITQLFNIEKEFRIITSNILGLIELCRSRGCDSTLINGVQASNYVSSLCYQMSHFINDFGQKKKVNNAQLEATLRKLKERLGELIDTTIKKDCKVVNDGLYSNISSLCLKWSLLALWQLTKNDAYICRIFTQQYPIVKRLIAIISYNHANIKLNNYNQLKAASFRILTHLCIIPEAVNQIYNSLDVEKHLINFLYREKNEIILREIVGFLVQITTPLIDYTKNLKKDNILSHFVNSLPIDSLVHGLTNIASTVNSREIFLLSAASLANISFYNSHCLIKNETLQGLISTSRKKFELCNDIPVKDQIITIIANVSSINPLEVVNCGALVYLICALQLRFSPSVHTDVELGAIERIQQKVATALTRLAANKYVASLIYRLDGCHRLVQLCKDSKERNYSDTVLVACLIALRRVCSALGDTPLKDLNAFDLIKLDLKDSFVLYTTQFESYV